MIYLFPYLSNSFRLSKAESKTYLVESNFGILFLLIIIPFFDELI